MTYFIILSIFILGMLVGSFLNVVVLRYNTGMTLGGRSGCFSCGKKLSWYELVPVVSWLAQKGRCRGCRAKISWQYPLVEALTGLMFAVVFWKEVGAAAISALGTVSIAPNVLVATLFYWIIFSLLIVILVYDVRHKIVPDGLVYSFAALSLLWSLAQIFLIAPLATPLTLAVPSVTVALWQTIIAGPVLFLPFFALWWLSRGSWIGLGDGKLALGIGWLIGLPLGASALVYAFWIGAVVSILLLAFRGNRFTMKSEIPFAPFIIGSIFLVYYFHVNVIDFISSIHFFS